MQDIHQIIAEVNAFATRTGDRPDLVCRKATGNPRLLDRLLRRARQTEIDWQRLRDFMNSVPVPQEDGAATDIAQVNAPGTSIKRASKRQEVAQ